LQKIQDADLNRTPHGQDDMQQRHHDRTNEGNAGEDSNSEPHDDRQEAVHDHEKEVHQEHEDSNRESHEVVQQDADLNRKPHGKAEMP